MLPNTRTAAVGRCRTDGRRLDAAGDHVGSQSAVLDSQLQDTETASCGQAGVSLVVTDSVPVVRSTDKSSLDHAEILLRKECLALADGTNQAALRTGHRLRVAQGSGEEMLEDCVQIARGVRCWAVLRQDCDANLAAKARCSVPVRSCQFVVDVDEVDGLHRSPG
ncbi:hypothetical protein PHISCL_10351 [Aspergillus sclerotialis]|uniref:Uncharacterized protein n=1 Tax=Aspergillus sclerotialis TaxID=2070753 RepID=A0A3A2Z2L4_9EURO|nr:hypothetical protein PHISCL_10351 [Aspergillus sclerotialis]